MDVTAFLQSINIVEYISQYVDLELRGDEWWGLSCFKEEKTPSFSVREDPGVFYDYSSGKGGNLLTFVCEYHKCSKADAINILKAYAGIGDGDFQAPERMAATLVCRRFAKKSKRVKESTATPLPDNYMDRFERPDDKLGEWEKCGISRESLDKYMVCYDRYSDRLVYPIRDASGRIINVGGRTLDPQWKEKHLRKYTYFQPWGVINTIYGLAENYEEIKKAGEIILFEGAKSVLLADTWGIHNCGAILTSHLSYKQMQLLAQLGCSVTFALDKEVDINEDKNINKLKQYVNVKRINDRENILEPKDAPVDKGEEVFRKLYDERIR